MNNHWEDPVDLEPFTEKEPPYFLPCGHQFKYKTLEGLKEKSCPSCRAPFKMNEILKNVSFLKGLKIRIALLGDSGVGKSCLLHRYENNKFMDSTVTTLGTEFTIVPFKYNGQSHEVIIQDTSGQEKFRSMTAQYYRNQDAFILAYDCEDLSSFENLQNWLEDCKQYANISNFSIAVTGTKADKDNDLIDKIKIKDFFQKNGLPKIIYEKTSSKTGAAVDALFSKLIIERIRLQQQDKGNVPIKQSDIQSSQYVNKSQKLQDSKRASLQQIKKQKQKKCVC